MARLVKGDKELTPVCAWAFVGHGYHAALRVLQGGLDLVLEIGAPDTAATFWVIGGRGFRGCAGLDHEGGDEAVEG